MPEPTPDPSTVGGAAGLLTLLLALAGKAHKMLTEGKTPKLDRGEAAGSEPWATEADVRALDERLTAALERQNDKHTALWAEVDAMGRELAVATSTVAEVRASLAGHDERMRTIAEGMSAARVLLETIERQVRETLPALDKRVDTHAERIAVLEARQEAR